MTESLIAITLALYLTANVSSVYYLIWCSFVPFGLLRTPEAVRLGQIKYRALHDKYEMRWGHIQKAKKKHTQHVLVGAMAASRFAINMLWARVAILVLDVMHNPFRCISTVPTNWRQVVLAIDSLYPPEVITGQNLVAKETDSASFNNLSRSAIEGLRTGSWGVRFLIVVLALPFFALAYLPSLLFRWSVKSTCIVWLGLLWGAIFTPIHGTRVGDLRTHGACVDYSKAILNTPMRSLAASFSVAILALILVKLFAVSIPLPVELFGSAVAARLVRELIVPEFIPPWQWASALVSGASLLTLWIAVTFARRAELPVPPNYRPVIRALGLCQLVVWGLRGYVIFCTLYIVWSTLSHINLPPLGNRIIPLVSGGPADCDTLPHGEYHATNPCFGFTLITG
tara:strand:+ start:119729 stop:120922 length:1194 start_codon:yes stop_codon:yes gene_type:complete